MAINFEHAWGDGVAVVRYLNEVASASAKDTYTPNKNPDSIITVQKLDFELDDKMKAGIESGEISFSLLVETDSFINDLFMLF